MCIRDRLKALADKHHIAILLIHHLRKMNDDDPMNMISGTTGISGATDSNFVLKERRRGSGEATLYCTGRDIEYRELPLVFDRFHKLDKSRSQNRDGWGLGLYIVKTIVCSHGEDISVSSKDGKTEFTFTMPLVN